MAARAEARRHSDTGSGRYGDGSAGSVGGTGLGRVAGGQRVDVGRGQQLVEARPSANRCRTNDSFDVFSSSRRTRYAMPGTSSPTGA